MNDCKTVILGLCCALSISVTGCGPGGPDIASVEGIVTMDGKPLEDCTVVFSAESGGRPAGAKTDADGKYVLNFSGGRQGAIPGPNIVRITMASGPYEGEDGKMIPARPETVPAKYNSMSELKFTVVDGEKNTANFDLDSKGAVARDQGGY